jgi:hypothetical protein
MRVMTKHQLRANFRVIKQRHKELLAANACNSSNYWQLHDSFIQELRGFHNDNTAIDLPEKDFHYYLQLANSFKFYEPWVILRDLTSQIDKRSRP